MIVWLNTDGSVGEIVSSYVLTDSDGNEYTAFSQREGNLAAGGIFVHFEGGNPSGGLAYSAWTLPTGSVSPTALKASWKKDCTIGLDKSRDMRKFKAEKAYEMQYFPFPDGLISEGGNGVYKVGITDSVDGKTYAYGPVLFSVAENSVVKETTITKTEYAELKADLESKADKSTLQADYQLQYSSTNVRAYYDAGKAYEDKANLAKNQYVLLKNEIASGSENMELLKVYIAEDGSNAFYQCAVAMEANRPYFVYTKANASPKGVTQYVDTGLCVDFVNSDDTGVKFGTNQSEFYAYVLDASGNYDGTISLGAKVYELNNAQGVKFLEMDDSATYLRSYNGTCELKMESGKATLKGNAINIAKGDETLISVTNGIAYAYAPIISRREVQFYDYAPTCDKAPTSDSHLANKSYVDATATEKTNAEQSRAQEKETDLQSQINALQESQNFVATVSTEADLVNIDTSKLEKGVDCVLVLTSTATGHEDQSVVYQWDTDGTWKFIGELGAYYTRDQIDDMFTNDQHIYVSEDGFVCVDYDKLPVRA